MKDSKTEVTKVVRSFSRKGNLSLSSKDREIQRFLKKTLEVRRSREVNPKKLEGSRPKGAREAQLEALSYDCEAKGRRFVFHGLEVVPSGRTSS